MKEQDTLITSCSFALSITLAIILYSLNRKFLSTDLSRSSRIGSLCPLRGVSTKLLASPLKGLEYMSPKAYTLGSSYAITGCAALPPRNMDLKTTGSVFTAPSDLNFSFNSPNSTGRASSYRHCLYVFLYGFQFPNRCLMSPLFYILLKQ